jgi:glycerol kinase
MQRLADLIGRAVDRPQIKETTALGAAYLSGLHAGFFPEPDRFLDRCAWSAASRRKWTPPCGNGSSPAGSAAVGRLPA